MKKITLGQLHPFSFLLFFTEALIACFVADKTGLAVIFAFLFLYAIVQKKAKTVLWSLPLAAFMLILNPIFYHGGETVLFQIKSINFTLEAIENGIYCALLILCTTLIFTVLGNALSEEKFLYVFGGVLPKTALMIAMIFKHFDLLTENYKQCKNMAQMNGIYDGDKTLFEKLKTNAVIFEAFTGAALEESLDTALSLSAKGYYSKKKTRMKLYHFQAVDVLIILVATAFFACTFLNSPLHYAALGALFLLPILFSERRKTV